MTRSTDHVDLPTINAKGNINMRGHRIIGLLDPLLDSEPATKGYVDDITDGIIGGETTSYVFTAQIYGAVGNGVTDDSQAMQDCIDAAYDAYVDTGAQQVAYFPPGIYLVGTKCSASASDANLLEPRPGVKIIGAGMDATIFLAADGYRSAAHGCSLLYNDHEFCEGMEIRGVTFDYGDNPVLSGYSEETRVGATTCANVILDSCKFVNTTGWWCFVVGPGTWDSLSDNCLITNCIFKDCLIGHSGDLGTDHTDIYSNMDHTMLQNCLFISDDILYLATAFELHGNDSEAFGNSVINYGNGCHLGAMRDAVSVATGQVVKGNFFRVCRGIQLWVSGGSSSAVDITVTDNDIQLLELANTDPSIGIYSALYDGPIKKLTVKGNTITNNNAESTTHPTYGIYVRNFWDASICGNTIHYATIGIITANCAALARCAIDDNVIENWGHGTGSSSYVPGIQVSVDRSSTLGGKMSVSHNTLIGNGYPEYGITIYALYVAMVDVQGNSIQGTSWSDMTVVAANTHTHGEKIFINHISIEHPASRVDGCQNGSTYADLSAATFHRMVAGVWETVAWTYV